MLCSAWDEWKGIRKRNQQKRCCGYRNRPAIIHHRMSSYSRGCHQRSFMKASVFGPCGFRTSPYQKYEISEQGEEKQRRRHSQLCHVLQVFRVRHSNALQVTRDLTFNREGEAFGYMDKLAKSNSEERLFSDYFKRTFPD